jgi:hypothetical protein
VNQTKAILAFGFRDYIDLGALNLLMSNRFTADPLHISQATFLSQTSHKNDCSLVFDNVQMGNKYKYITKKNQSRGKYMQILASI